MQIVWTTQFKQDYKLALKRHLDIELSGNVIRSLSRGETLPERNKDHALTGDLAQYRSGELQARNRGTERKERIRRLIQTGSISEKVLPEVRMMERCIDRRPEKYPLFFDVGALGAIKEA